MFSPYDTYKDSGVPWLGAVPTHWKVDRFKASIASIKNGVWGQEPEGTGSDIACVRVADFDRPRLRVSLGSPTMRCIAEGERKGRLLKRGDLLLEKSGGGEKQPVGFVVQFDHPNVAVTSNFIAKMELAARMDPSYWCYLHAGAYAVRLNVCSINQTSGIQNLDHQRYLDERAAFPPEAEQVAIGKFLDAETSRIDALFDENERLVKLLLAKRAAVVFKAVTKGLSSDVPMRHSGVPALGAVPAHWGVAPLKRYWTAIDCKHLTAEFVLDGIPLASIREVQGRWVNLDEAKCTTEAFYEQLIQGGRKPVLGDLIFSRNATVGEVAQVPRDCPRFAMGQDVVLLRKRTEGESSDYLQHLIRSAAMIVQLDMLMIGSTFKRINVEEVKSLVIPHPPASEQREICAVLDEELQAIDALIDEANLAMSLLRARRASLIFGAVTGKFDVRKPIAGAPTKDSHV